MNNSGLGLIIAITLFGTACTSEQDLGEHGTGGMAGSGTGGSSTGGAKPKNTGSASGGQATTDPSTPQDDDDAKRPIDNEPPATGSETIEIKNLNAYALNGLIRLTFALENRMNVRAAYCQIGTISTSTGHQATAEFSRNPANSTSAFTRDGWCRGFWGEQDPGHFCADENLSPICDETGIGLSAHFPTGVLELSAYAEHSNLIAWEKPGTEYRLTLRFLMEDAAVVEASATTTLK